MSTPAEAPVLPPKPDSHEASRRSTPIGPGLQGPTSPSHPDRRGPDDGQSHGSLGEATTGGRMDAIPSDPGDLWLPEILQDKSKQDLAAILADADLLNAMTHSSSAVHPSLLASHRGLQSALAENVDMASRLVEAEGRLAAERSTTQAQLLSTHALERQWRQKQADLDTALLPFSPASLYQRLGHGVQEQAMVCNALEESFLDGNGEEACATERETAEWIRRYREAKTLYYQRLERKERWDEGRVGGWR